MQHDYTVKRNDHNVKRNDYNAKRKDYSIIFSGMIIMLSGMNINYLCTCDLYTPVHNVLEAWIYITWGSWRGLGTGIPEFFGPCEMLTSR